MVKLSVIDIIYANEFMYTLTQIETNGNQILSFKSMSSTDRYYDIFINRERLNSLKFLHPILIPSKGYSYAQLNKWDFFNCIISIPIFSKNFKNKIGDLLSEEIEFVYGEISSIKGNIGIYMGLIKNVLSIIDECRSNKRFLDNGDLVIDSPFYYSIPPKDFFIARDKKHPSKYVVSQKFKNLCESNGFELGFNPVLF